MVSKISYLFIVLLATSCSAPQPDIQIACETDDVFNYIIKWELYPSQDGTVKIYESTDPAHFNTRDEPLAELKISDGRVRLVANHRLHRQYFLLRFNDRYDRITGTRAPRVAGVQNFRDIGGYETCNEKSVRWGMIYRSGHLDSVDLLGIKSLKQMGIRTVIDFRDSREFHKPTRKLRLKNTLNLPIQIKRKSQVENRLVHNEFRRGDAAVFMQDVYVDISAKYADRFKAMFDQLLEKDNYPVVISCVYGKDFTGFATAMILSALDVPEEIILDDYMLSNQYIDKSFLSKEVRHYSTSGQEAITKLMSADRKFLECTLQKIKREYGSIDNYLDKKMGMNAERRKELREILLY